jgi:hypothetical protein
MSAWGFGGFANGFMQGFSTMGKEFAQRGLLRREREASARDERRLALEEELKRSGEQRANAESELRREEMSLTNAALRDKGPYVAPAAKAQVGALETELQGKQFDLEHKPELYGLDVDSKRANIASTQATTAGAVAKNNEIHDTAESDRKVQDAHAGYYDQVTQAKQIENDEARAVATKNRALSEAFGRFTQNKHTQDDADLIAMAVPLGGSNIAEINKVLDEAQKKVKETGGQYNPQVDPVVLNALGDVLGGFIGRTRGMAVNLPGAPDKQYTVNNTRLVGFDRNPENPQQLGPVFEVEAAATPELQSQIDAKLKSGVDETGKPLSPQQMQELQAQAKRTYRAPLTQGRVPFAQGGERVWFTAEDFNRMRGDLGKAEVWQQNNPDLAKTLAEMKQRQAAGVPLLADKKETEGVKPSDQISAHRENRETFNDAQSAQDKKLKTVLAQLEKPYKTIDLNTGMSNYGNRGEELAALQQQAIQILEDNPKLTVGQVLAKVKKPAKPAVVQMSADGKGKDYTDLF